MSGNLGSLLDEAKQTITGERQDQYGAPEDSFPRIAAYWTTYLGRPVSALDVAHLMALMKLARAQGRGFKRDTYVDLAGYAAIAADRLGHHPESAPAAAPEVKQDDPVITPLRSRSLYPNPKCKGCLHEDQDESAEPCVHCYGGNERVAAPAVEQSCETCLYAPVEDAEECKSCENSSNWTDG